MKSIYLFEAESVNKYRENIIKERLVYIKYLMDNTSDKKEVSKLEKIYNCLYNINYDSNGKLRTLNDMFTYINQTMTENKGLIPDLPTNDQIQTIDEKAAAFKKLHEKEFNAYLTRFEKVNIDKADNKPEDDDAKSVLSPENPEDNKKALSKIREISSVFGLTNIIGLEPKRQPSSKDIENQKELKLQQKTGDPNAKPEDNEEETKQINKEKSNTEPEQQPGGEDTTKEPGKKTEDTGDAESDEDNSINGDLGDPEKMDDDEKQEFGDDFVDMLKEDPDSLDELLAEVDKDTESSPEDKEKLKENLKKIAQDIKDGKYDEEESTQEPVGESFISEAHGYGRAALIGLCFAGVGVVPALALNAIRRHIGKKKVKRTVKRMEKAIDNATDEKTKEKLKKDLADYKQARYDDKGKICVSKRSVKKNIIKKQNDGKLPSDYSYDSQKQVQKTARNSVRIAKTQNKDGVVKDKDGSQIIVRAKESGKGKTYVRVKNGKEIGYATKDEYKAAKEAKKAAMKAAKEQQKESLSIKSLSDYLLESLQ